MIDKHLSEVKHHERMSALQNKTKTHKKILPFVTEYRPSVPNLKKIIMHKWYLIENQPLLREIFKDPPIISYRRGKSLQDILVVVYMATLGPNQSERSKFRLDQSESRISPM